MMTKQSVRSGGRGANTRPLERTRRTWRCLRTLCGVTISAAALASTSASADVIFSAGAGGVVPWEGSGNYSVMGSIGFNPFSDFTRLAFEFEYRNQDTAVDLRGAGFGIVEEMSVDGVDVPIADRTRDTRILHLHGDKTTTRFHQPASQ